MITSANELTTHPASVPESYNNSSILRSAHLENTFREYVSAGHSVFLQGSGLLPATLTLIFFISRHVE